GSPTGFVLWRRIRRSSTKSRIIIHRSMTEGCYERSGPGDYLAGCRQRNHSFGPGQDAAAAPRFAALFLKTKKNAHSKNSKNINHGGGRVHRDAASARTARTGIRSEGAGQVLLREATSCGGPESRGSARGFEENPPRASGWYRGGSGPGGS